MNMQVESTLGWLLDLWDGHRPKDPNLIGGLQHQFAFAALSLLVRELYWDST